jgi:hypothetical protein
VRRFATTAHKKSPGTLYLGLFAGDHENLSRTIGQRDQWLPPRCARRRATVRQDRAVRIPGIGWPARVAATATYPSRDLEVVPGDCNETVPPTLLRLKREQWNLAPAFALVDRYAAEVRWSTVEDNLFRFGGA